MFTQFSAHLYEKAVKNHYQFYTADNENIDSAKHWIVQKIEMATLVMLHVIDGAQISLQTLMDYDKRHYTKLETTLDQSVKVENLYIIAGEAPPEFDSFQFEEYFGQQIYSIFWHINLRTGEITVPKGQPKELFYIRKIVLEAYNGTGEENDNPTFSEISSRIDALRPKVKHSYPIISYVIILINAAILGIMYLYGYPDSHISVPVRFGAIAAELVINNGEWYRLFTSMFLHFGAGHLFANCFGILIFGTRLERFLGRRIFIITYIFSGLVGSAFSLINLYFFQHSAISAGASGAVYGIVGAIFAYTRISKNPIEFINWYFMLIYIGIGIAMGIATPGIDNFGHMGGLIGGMIIGGAYAKISSRA